MAKVPFVTQEGKTARAVINIESVGLTPEQFFRLCCDNEARIELTAEKELIIMSPTNRETARQNAEITYQLAKWAKKDRTGVACDSNALYTLPNGAKRSPDASWTQKSRWNAIKSDPRDHFDLVCPDFVLELWSPSDPLKTLHAKMLEYMENGAQLGFLVYPHKRQVWIYRPNQKPIQLDNPTSVSGDPELPEFALDLTEIWP
jgi:Uma2 family endonuclease